MDTLFGFLDPPFWSSIHTVGSKDDNKPISHAMWNMSGHLDNPRTTWVHADRTERS